MGLRRTKVDSLIEAKKCYLYYIQRDALQIQRGFFLPLFSDARVIEMWPDEKTRKTNVDQFLMKTGIKKLEINKHNQLLEIYDTYTTRATAVAEKR